MSDDVTINEKIEVIDKFTQQMVNSNYERKQIIDVVLSSLKGTATKEKRRKKKKERKYKSSKETLSERIEKKLTEAVSWYRNEIRKEEDESDTNDLMKRKRGSWEGWRKYKRKGKSCVNLLQSKTIAWTALRETTVIVHHKAVFQAYLC